MLFPLEESYFTFLAFSSPFSIYMFLFLGGGFPRCRFGDTFLLHQEQTAEFDHSY